MRDNGQDSGHVPGSIQTIGLTRRGFVVSTLAAGFALAVRPVWAETIVTDSTGLTAGEVMIPTDDGSIPAYQAMPSQGRSFPVVLVVQEIFEIMRLVNREQGVSILLVEQNAALALALADHAYLLETGQVVISGTSDSIRSDETIRRSYLGY